MSGLLFRNLAEHFNGDVFGPLPELISTIDQSVFVGISSLLQGDDLMTGQMALWPYDFNVLPVDLVSSIYEQLLEETRQVNSAYYTPRFMVNMLLDETVRWADAQLPQIIDLACGSGAFMTEAFRRLCYREQRRLGRTLSYDELQGILKGHIFGIDVNEVAARTAVFGLYLALLEQLDPPTIWESARLPTLLNQNVVVADAFEQHPLADRKFDLVIGNPPWQSALTKAAQKFVAKQKRPVADKQAASAFLWLGFSILRPGGTLGLVMPAKPLLHNRSDKAVRFRTDVFTELNVRVVADLSAIRRQLFRNAVGPAAIIVADTPNHHVSAERSSIGNEVLYVSAHPRPLTGAVDALAIAPEEIRSVSRKQAESRPEIWSTLLWGTVRDIELLDRLRIGFRSLGDIADERNWERSQGYQVGGGDTNDASHLHGFPIVPTDAVWPLHLSNVDLELFAFDYLHRTRKPALFKGPHVLVRRTIARGRIGAVLLEHDAVFSNGLIGIAGPSDDTPLLATVAAILASSLSCYWQFMTSSSWGAERDFVELSEYLSMPIAFPTNLQAEDFLALSRQASGGSVSRDLVDEMVFALYQLETSDRERIQDFVLNDIPRFLGSQKLRPMLADGPWLKSYGRVIAGVLSDAFGDVHIDSVVGRRGRYCTVAITVGEATDGPVELHSDDQPVTVDVDGLVEILQQSRKGESTGVFALPAGFFVRNDTIYIVKTADRDRWSRDAALSDADRIFASLAFGE